jgi:hypothetical protein
MPAEARSPPLGLYGRVSSWRPGSRPYGASRSAHGGASLAPAHGGLIQSLRHGGRPGAGGAPTRGARGPRIESPLCTIELWTTESGKILGRARDSIVHNGIADYGVGRH